ncbi:MAG: class I SAM-dependent methyltransferase [Magnetococcales bacterium]|nr:class I SAM-dependent methyltransferase [Magnetococcales bacterium]
MTLFLIFMAALVPVIAIVIHTLLTGSPPTPSSPKVQAKLMAMLPDALDGSVIYELGSGWGGLAVALSKRYPRCRVIGLERSHLPWLISRMRGALRRRHGGDLTFLRQDIFTTPLHEAGLVCCYLLSPTMEKLRPKFQHELPHGSRVACLNFAVPHWKPVQTQQATDLYATKIYLYRVPDSIPYR